MKLYSCPLLARLQEAAGRGETPAHHVTVYGCASRNFGLREMLESYYYQTVAGFCSASLKLIRIGQEGAQRVLSACLAKASVVIDASLALPSDEIGWFDISMDIASMRHEIADERLFIS
jgi:urease accessory protein